MFADDEDYCAFLELFAAALTRFGVRCVAYCLLWNHYHVLLVPGAHPISRLQQQLGSAYAQRFNRRHQRVGHLLQGRFGCRIVEDGAYARTVLRYLALNPVAAGRVPRPEDWRWSSYRFAAGLADTPEFLSLDDVWAAFGTTEADAGRARFMQFVAAGLLDTFDNPILHGTARLRRRLAPELARYEATRDHVCAARFAARPSLGSLVEGCLDRGALEEAAHAAFHRHAYTLAEIAAVVNRDPSVVSRWIQRAARRAAQSTASSGEDIRARNKI
jgi:REP element-mobilizing transposase RayT